MQTIRNLLRVKLIRILMLFVLISGISVFLYGGCNDDDNDDCRVVDDLDLGIADDAEDCDSIADQFNCFDGIFDPQSFDCDGDDCVVCEDGSCDLDFKVASNAECGILEVQFDCDDSFLADADCSLDDCLLCQP